MPGMDHVALGPFMVAADGVLTPMRPPELRFAWRGRDCAAVLAEGQMTLSAEVGAVPYTVEQPDARPVAFAELGALPEHLPEGWRVRLLPDHRVKLESAVRLGDNTTATTLLTAMVGFALALDPYLDRLELVGVGSPGSVRI
jgi:hypothetical protein